MSSSVPRHAPMAAFIVGDDEHRHQSLSLFLETYYPDVEIITEASAVSSAKKLMEEADSDALPLDYHVTERDNVNQILVHEDQNLLVVFVPPHTDGADTSDTVRYVLTLTQSQDLEETIAQLQHAFEQLLESKQQAKPENVALSENDAVVEKSHSNGKIILPTSEGLIVQAVAEIIRLESDNYYTTVVRKDLPKILLTKTLKDFEAALDPEEFLRVHNSHIISISWLERFDKRDGGYVVMYDGSRVPVSRRRQHLLLERLQRYRHV